MENNIKIKLFAVMFLLVCSLFLSQTAHASVDALKHQREVLNNFVTDCQNLDFQNGNSLVALQQKLPAYQKDLESFLAFYKSQNVPNSASLINGTESAIKMTKIMDSLIKIYLSI